MLGFEDCRELSLKNQGHCTVGFRDDRDLSLKMWE